MAQCLCIGYRESGSNVRQKGDLLREPTQVQEWQSCVAITDFARL